MTVDCPPRALAKSGAPLIRSDRLGPSLVLILGTGAELHVAKRPEPSMTVDWPPRVLASSGVAIVPSYRPCPSLVARVQPAQLPARYSMRVTETHSRPSGMPTSPARTAEAEFEAG
jgi:hypothetical protein